MPKEGSKYAKSGKTTKTDRVLSLLTDPAIAGEDETKAGEPKEAADSETAAQIRDALEAELAAAPAPHPRKSAAPAVRQSSAPAAEPPAAEVKPMVPAAEPPAAEVTPAAPAAEPPVAEVKPAVPSAEPPVAEVTPAARPEVTPVTLEEFPVPEDAVVLSAPEPEPVPAPASAPEPEPAPAPEPEPAPVPAPAPAPEPVLAPALEPVPTPALEQAEDEHYTCLNVTQALVEEKADKYIKMFGMCDCPRCRIDVIAMAMSNLPAKYVVVRDQDINPRLSMYEAKYNAAVVTQVMSACKKVTERPHHVRK